MVVVARAPRFQMNERNTRYLTVYPQDFGREGLNAKAIGMARLLTRLIACWRGGVDLKVGRQRRHSSFTETRLSGRFKADAFEMYAFMYPSMRIVCFPQVHLSTHDPINKNTAKASLQQMLSVVFSRMEARDAELKKASDVIVRESTLGLAAAKGPLPLSETSNGIRNRSRHFRWRREEKCRRWPAGCNRHVDPQ